MKDFFNKKTLPFRKFISIIISNNNKSKWYKTYIKNNCKYKSSLKNNKK